MADIENRVKIYIDGDTKPFDDAVKESKKRAAKEPLKIDVKFDASEIKSSLDEINKELKTIGKKGLNIDTKEFENSLKRVGDYFETVAKEKEKLGEGTKVQLDDSSLKEFSKSLTNLKNNVFQISAELKSSLSFESVIRQNEQAIIKASRNISRESSKIGEDSAKSQAKRFASMGRGNIELDRFKTNTNGLKTLFDYSVKEFQRLGDLSAEIRFGPAKEDAIQLRDVFTEVINKIQEAQQKNETFRDTSNRVFGSEFETIDNLKRALDADSKLKTVSSLQNVFNEKTSAQIANVVEQLDKFISEGKGLDKITTAFEGINKSIKELETTLSGVDFTQIAKAASKASQSVGKATEKSHEFSRTFVDQKKISQTGLVSDGKMSYVTQPEMGQKEYWTIKTDKNGRMMVSTRLITSYQELEQTLMDADIAMKRLEEDSKRFAANGIDTTEIQALMDKINETRSQAMTTLRYTASSKNYAYSQADMERLKTAREENIENYYRTREVQKGRDQLNEMSRQQYRELMDAPKQYKQYIEQALAAEKELQKLLQQRQELIAKNGNLTNINDAITKKRQEHTNALIAASNSPAYTDESYNKLYTQKSSYLDSAFEATLDLKEATEKANKEAKEAAAVIKQQTQATEDLNKAQDKASKSIQEMSDGIRKMASNGKYTDSFNKQLENTATLLDSINKDVSKSSSLDIVNQKLKEAQKIMADISSESKNNTNIIFGSSNKDQANLVNTVNHLDSLRKKFKELGLDTVDFNGNIVQVSDRLNQLEQALKSVDSVGAFEDARNGLKLFEEQTKESIAQAEKLAETVKKSDDYVKKIQQIGKDLSGMADQRDKSYNEKYTKKFQEALRNEATNWENYQKGTQSLDKLAAAYEDALTAKKKFVEESKYDKNVKAQEISIEKLRLKIEQFANTNSAMGSKFRAQFDVLLDSFKQASLAKSDISSITAEFLKLEQEVTKAGKAGRGFFDTLQSRIKQMSTNFIAMYFSLYDIIRYTKEMFSTVKEFDTALTEMRKVSEESIKTLQSYQTQSFKTADAVGTTALALQKSAADWMRLGESISQAKKSAETTSILFNVSEFENIDLATEAMVSASQAYKELEKIDIVDKLNIIGNNFEISTDQLATGLQNAAAVLKTQGNSIEEALALLTAGNSITQDISKASMGIRTIALRISGTEEAKDQLIEMGEDTDDFIVATHAKMQELIKDYTAVASNAYQGVDILDANGNLKNTYDILLAISKVYQEIIDEDKKAGTNRGQALVEALAGKTRSNIAASILLNPDKLESVYNTALRSENSAQEELDKYMESLDGKVAQFKNSVQELIFDLQASDFMKGLVDFGKELIQILDKMVEYIGPGGSLLTIFSLWAGVAHGSTIKKGLTSVLNTLANLSKAVPLTDEELILLGYNLVDDAKAAEILGDSLSSAGSQGKQSASLIVRAWNGVSSALSAAGISMGAFVGALAAVGVAIYGVIEAEKATKAIRESSQQFADNYKEAKSDIESYKDEIQSLHKTISDSNSTYEESKSARERLYAIQSTLIENYGTERNAIDLITKSIKGEVEALDELSAKQWRNQLNAFNDQNIEGRVDWLARAGAGFVKDNVSLMLRELEGGDGNGIKIRIQGDFEDKEELQRLAEIYGDIANYSFEFGETENIPVLELTGNAMQLEDILVELQNKTKDGIFSKAFTESLNLQEKNVSEVTDAWKDFYDQYVLNEYVLSKGSIYQDNYSEYLQYIDEYQKAFSEGNETAIEESVKNLHKAYIRLAEDLDKDRSLEDAQKQAIRSMFDSIAPEIQSQINQTNFEMDLSNTNIKVNEKSISQILKQVSDAFNYSEDVLNFQSAGANSDQIKAYEQLEVLTERYNVSLEYLCELLQRRNQLESKSDVEFIAQRQKRLYIFGRTLGYTEDELDAFTKDFTLEDWGDFQGLEDNLVNFQKYQEALERYNNTVREAEELGGDLNQLIYGNIDLGDHGRRLEWTAEAIEKYSDALRSWGDNPEDYFGTFSTENGMWDKFGKNKDIKIAFSPMLRTKDGIEYLDRDTVLNYINSIVEKSEETGIDILKLDKDGIGEVKGLIAAVGDEAEKVSEFMHHVGPDGAVADALNGLQEAYEKLQTTKIPSFDEAVESAKSFMTGTEDVASELEIIQTIFSNTKNVGEDVYTSLLSHSNKYSNALVSQNGRLEINKNRLLATADARVKEQRSTLRQVAVMKKLEYLKKYKELKMYDMELVDSQSETYKEAMALQEEITQLDLLSNSLEQATDMFARFKEAQETANSPDYETAKSAYDVIKESLKNGQVGTDDFEAAQQLLMSLSDYEEFMSKTDYESKFKFMEDWSKNTSKFFTDDQARNAQNFLDAIKEAGLVEDGILHSSKEIGEELHLSHDAVNGLIEDVNLYGFGGEIIRQSPVDMIDSATEALSNYTSAQEALNQAQKDGADQKYILSLSEDLDKAKERWDDLAQTMPKILKEAEESSANTGRSLLETLFDIDENGELTQSQEANISAFVTAMSTRVEELKTLFGETNEEAMALQQSVATISHAQYEQRVEGIEERLSAARMAKQKYDEALAKTQETRYDENGVVLNVDPALLEQLQSAENLITDLTTGQHLIELQLDQTTLQNELDSVTKRLEELNSINITQSVGLGGYNAAQGEKKYLEEKEKTLKEQTAELETILTFTPETDKADEAREDLSKDVNTDVIFNPITTNVDLFLQKLKQLETNPISIPFVADTTGFEVPHISGGSNSGGGNYGTNGGFANGTAHAQGVKDWALSHNENGSLVGELGAEGLVRDGKFYLIGKNGPERKNLKKGDIIFNHKQTEELLKNGYATERGTLIGSGFVDGSIATAHSDNKLNVVTEDINIGRFAGAVSKASDKAAKEVTDDIDKTTEKEKENTDNFIDWIERRITSLSNHAKRSLDIVQKALDRVTNLTSRGGKKGTTAFKTFNKTLDSLYNTALDSQKKVIENQKLAYEAYNIYANAVGLDPTYQEKIKNGIMEIENVTDEALQKQIQQYQDYYDKSQSALDGLIEAAEAFYKIPLDKAAQKIENLSNKIEYLDKAISNATNYKTRNKLLDDQDKAQKQINKAQKVSLKEAQQNQKTAKKAVKQTALKENDKELKQINKEIKQEKKTLKAKKTLSKVSKAGKKEIKKATKNNEAIDLSTLKKGSKAYKEAEKYNASLNEKSEKKLVKKAYDTKNVINPDNFKEGSKAWQAVVEYNAAITATTEAYNNAKNAEEEWLHWHRVEMPKAKFDNIARDFDNAVTMIGYDLTDIQNRVSELQQFGKKIALEYYNAEINLEEEQLERYTKERIELEKSLRAIQQYSDEWYEAYNKIKEVDNAISQLTISVSQLRDTVNQMVAESFTNMQDDFSKLMDEVDFYTHLMSHEKKTDDKIGYFTAAGLDDLSLAMQKYNYSLEKTQIAQKAVNDLLYIQEHYNELQAQSSDKIIRYADYQIESQEKLNELQEAAAQANRDAIKEQYDMYSSVVDLMKERYQSELAFYKQLISDKKESLDMEKSLYEYQKKISEKTKNLAKLQKQLAAYSGDSSQEGMAKRQKLQSEITKAQEDLRDTEYDKYIQDQKDMLDSLAEEYEERIETKLEQFRELFEEANTLSQTNTQHIVDTINQIDSESGYIPKLLQNLDTALIGSETGLKPALLTALTGNANVISKSVIDGNSTIHTDMTKVLAAIENVNGKTATQNNVSNDPGATSPPAYTVSNTLKDVPVSDMKLPTGGLAPAATLQNKDFEDLGKATAKVQKETEKKAMKEKAEKFIKKFAAVNKDGPSNGKKYSAVNQKIAEMMGATSKTAEKKKKVLTAGQLKELAGILGVVYDNASASGNLYKKLHSLGIGGFSQGGFVESVNKAIWKNGDDGIATVKVGEAILTPTDSKNLASLAKNFETIDVTADILRSLKESAKTGNFGATAQNIDYGGVNFNFDLEGVTDPTAFVHAIQTDSSLQKAIQSVSVDRINGGGRLNVQRIK